MANYTCEEIPSCTNFQSAICLHCNHRLCLFHIGEHNKIVFDDIENLSKEAEAAFHCITEDSEKNKITYNNVLTSLDEWRTVQIGKIDQIYENQLQCITSRQQTLEQHRQELSKKLEDDVLQQLRVIKSQENASMGVLSFIQQTIKQIRKDSKHLNWVFPTPPIVNIGQIRSDTTPISTQQSTADINTSPRSHSTTTTRSSQLSSTTIMNLKSIRLFPRLIEMFASISSIKQSKNSIETFIRNQGESFKLANLVCSYLTAWYRQPNIDEKVFLLNEHISTIQHYLINRDTDLDILIGIQVFFHNIKITEEKYKIKSIFVSERHRESPAEEMMIFLLQFFLNHQCINESLILTWYNHKGLIGSKGFGLVKPLVKSFIRSISITNTVNNVQAVSTDPIIVEQHINVHIEEETVAST